MFVPPPKKKPQTGGKNPHHMQKMHLYICTKVTVLYCTFGVLKVCYRGSSFRGQHS